MSNECLRCAFTDLRSSSHAHCLQEIEQKEKGEEWNICFHLQLEIRSLPFECVKSNTPARVGIVRHRSFRISEEKVGSKERTTFGRTSLRRCQNDRISLVFRLERRECKKRTVVGNFVLTAWYL